MAAKTFVWKQDGSELFAQCAQRELAAFSPRLLVFFASGVYEPQNPAQQLSKVFHRCRIVGCTSHSEFCGGSFGYNSIVVLALDEDSVEDVQITVVENASSREPLEDVIELVQAYFGGEETLRAQPERYVGLVLFDAAAKIEEPFMEQLRALTAVPYVGGTASDAGSGVSRVYAGGKGYADAVVLATLKTPRGYHILKTQSAQRLSETVLEVTRADARNRIVYQLNGWPAAEVYAELTGVPVSRLEEVFATHPLGEYVQEELYLRTVKERQPKGSFSLHCGVEQGAQVYLMRTGDIVKAAEEMLREGIDAPPAAVLNFTCLHCTMALESTQQMEAYCALWQRYPSIGLSCFGEAYVRHINQTITVLVLR